MKICICTTPIRPYPTNYPPFGSLAVIQALRQIGYQADFFNIDFHRYSDQDVRRHFESHQYDVVGISAVVSTAYAYTKQLATWIRTVSPHTTIVVGGNLAASAEILLRKTEVDFCVAGDGEFIIQDLVRALEASGRGNFDALRAVKGIAFLDEHQQFEFTGYGRRPTASELEAPDFAILEADGSLHQFVEDCNDDTFMVQNGAASKYPKQTTVSTAKGCVARCTFCHRWEKGFRAKPALTVADHVRHLRDHYGVGFIELGDENFGSDKAAAEELAKSFHELGVMWRCAGVRTRTVTREMLQLWKDNGCRAVVYGIESGSPSMLEVMEKNTTVEQNIKALRWTAEAGLDTVVQLVLGMPGETDKTIHETVDFLKNVSEFLEWGAKAPSEEVSVNYAQALPGTPLYEWAREKGFIGTTLDEEEKYLLRISDTDAYSEDHFINYTGLPLLQVLCWRPLLLAKLDAHYFTVKGVKPMSVWRLGTYYSGLLLERLRRRLRGGATGKNGTPRAYSHKKDSGYFNVQSGLKFAPLLMNPWTRPFFYPILAVAVAFWRGGSLGNAVRLIADHVSWSLFHRFRQAPDLPTSSLRKIVSISARGTPPSADKMLALRLGR